jgi:hypothetical protein
VANWHSVDRSNGKLAKFTFAPWRYSYPPTLNLADGSFTIKNGDQITFTLKRDCLNHKAKLYRKYNSWREHEFIPESTDNLVEGTHYYLWYYSSSLSITFPVAQVYIAQIIDKITPVELASFRTPGVTESWVFSDGDQAFGDTIMFSSDWTSPKSTDLKITRMLSGMQKSII